LKSIHKIIILFFLSLLVLFTSCGFDISFGQDFTKVMEEDVNAIVTFYAFDPEVNSYLKNEISFPIGKVLTPSVSFPTATYKGVKKGYDLAGWYFKEGTGTVLYDDNKYVSTYTVGTNGATFYGAWVPRTDTPYKLYCYVENPDDDEYKLNEKAYTWMYGTTDAEAEPTEAMNREGFTIDRHYGTKIDAEGNGVLYIWYKRKIVYLEFYSDGKCYFAGKGKYGSQVPYKETPTKNYYHISSLTYVGLNDNEESGETKTNGYIWQFPPKDRKYTAVWERNDSTSGFSIGLPNYVDVDLELSLSFDSTEKVLTASCKEGYYTYTWFLDGNYVNSYTRDNAETTQNTCVILNSAGWAALEEAEHEIMVDVRDGWSGNNYSGNITFRKLSSGYGE